MYKKLIFLLLVFILLFTACQSAPPKTDAPSEPVSEPVSSPALDYAAMLATENTIDEPWVTEGLFVPPVAEGESTTLKTTYLLCEGTPMQTEVVVLTAAEPGETLYLIAGIHGDEVASFSAADRMKDMELKSGTLCILSPANAAGAASKSRHVAPEQDGNRTFPGDPEGNEAEQLAYAIFEDVKRVNPAFVFDLHEAIVVAQNRDFLGSSLIYTDLAGMETMFLDLYMATQTRELCSMPFNYHGPSPAGSINSTITKELGIPTITVETYRAFVLERRIEDQMALVGYVLRYYGLVD